MTAVRGSSFAMPFFVALLLLTAEPRDEAEGAEPRPRDLGEGRAETKGNSIQNVFPAVAPPEWAEAEEARVLRQESRRH